MDQKKVNNCICCTVQQCVHNNQASRHCTLDSITVGTHESNPSMDQCTDCLSFKKR